jgi:hypothetical protein
MITIYKLKDDSLEFEPIGQIENGEIVDGGDALEQLVPEKLRGDEKELLNRFDGPRYLASSTEYGNKKEKGGSGNGYCEVDGEQLEIRDYYRVWVKSESDVPEGRTAHRGDETAPVDNKYYYEVPFQTSTVIDVGEFDKMRVDPTDHPSRQDLVDMGIPDPDLSLTKSNGEVSLNPAEYREAESPLTLFHLYKKLYDQGSEYTSYLSILKRELNNRGILSFERIAKSRLVRKDEGGWTEETGPRGATRWRRGDEIRYKPPAGASESDESSTTSTEESPAEETHDPYNRPVETTTAPVGELEAEDFAGTTFRFYDDDNNPVEDLTVVDVVNNPTTLMGPNAGYVEFEDGTYATLTGNDYADLFSDDDTVRAFTDSEAVVQQEVYQEPTGEPNPDGWDIQWEVENEDRDLDRLNDREKEQFLKEWHAASPEGGFEDIEDAFYQIKAVTTSTGGQLLDKAMQAAHGIAGEPRTDEHMDDRDFEDSDDPTEAEVEAARVFTKASQKFMQENFGDEFTLHRGLGNHVVEPLYDTLLDRFAEGSTDDLVIKDNPVATWTTDQQMANSYDKGIVARKQFEVGDVLSTPEALLDMEGDVRAMTDYSEGETNVAGWDMSVDPGDLYVSKTNVTFRELMEDPVAAHLRDIEDEDSGTKTTALHSFITHIRHRDKPEAAKALRRKLEASDVYQENPDLFDSIPKQLEVMLDKNDTVGDDTSGRDVIDIRSDADWLVESRDERTEKGRRYVTSSDEAPEGVDVEEGPQGGLYYDTGTGDSRTETQKISIGKIVKNPNYVNDPSEAPEWATVQEGPQGGYYYEESQKPSESDDDSRESPSADDLISEIGLGSLDEVGEVISRGIVEGVDLAELGDRIADEKSGRYINRVLGDVEQAVSKQIDGYENPVKMTYSWDDDFDFPGKAQQKFMESVDEETGQLAKQAMETWPLDFFSEDMAPLWKTVMAETGNTNLLKDEEQVTETEVSDAQMDAVRAYKQHTEDTLREIHGDSITVYRGVYGDAGHSLIEAAEAGEEIEWERRAVESYTTELTYAKSYAQNPGGVVVEQEIPVEDVWASSHTGFLDANENELVVQKESVETISPDNIHTPETLDDGSWNIEEVGEQARRFRQ